MRNAQSYLPAYLVHQLESWDTNTIAGRSLRLEGVTLSADIAGFTGLSEALSSIGQHGAEELTYILNDYFGTMIGMVQTTGGDVMRFGGDALSVVFPCLGYTPQSTVRRAVLCALRMQKSMSRYVRLVASAGIFDLSMRVGVAYGTVNTAVVGDPGRRLEYLVYGDALTNAVAAEKRAASGEVILDRSVLTLVDPSVRWSRRSGGFALAIQVGGQVRKLRNTGSGPAIPNSQKVAVLSRFTHPRLGLREGTDIQGFGNEHRNVVTVFAAWPQASLAGADGGQRAQELLAPVVELVHGHGGHLARLDTSGKEARALCVFGAPTSHRDNEERAVRFCQALRDAQGSAIRIGMSAGLAFCGDVGADERSEYTVMGDIVNLASRLQQQAQPGEVLAEASVRDATRTSFRWSRTIRLTVKGRRGHIRATVLRSSKAHRKSGAGELPVVGRENELKQVAQKLERADRGHGHFILITGEAGIGKSRLSTEAASLANARGFTICTSTSLENTAGHDYAPWRDIVISLLGLHNRRPGADLADACRRALARFEITSSTQLFVLGTILGLSLAEDEKHESLDRQMRADIAHTALLQLIRTQVQHRALLIVIDDAHLMDAASFEALRAMANAAATLPLSVILLARPIDSAPAIRDWSNLGDVASHISLSVLAEPDALRLVTAKWRSVFPRQLAPSATLAAIARRAQGNPLFIESIIDFMASSGVDPAQPMANAADIPGDLASLMLSQVDQLPSHAAITLKAASVIGQDFDLESVCACMALERDADAVKESLDQARHASLLASDLKDGRYAFRHGLIQETLYASLSQETRVECHTRAGQDIERRFSDDLAPHTDQLAFHYGRTRDTHKQRIYLRKAADAAKARYANREAITHYERLLPLLARSESLPVLLSASEAGLLTGDLSKCERWLKRAIAIAESSDDLAMQAQCLCTLGQVYAARLTNGAAVGALERARATYQHLDDDLGVCRTLLHLSFAYFQLGEIDLAFKLSSQHLAIATRLADQTGIADALHNLGQIHMQRNNLRLARKHLDEALRIARGAGYRLRVVHVSNDLAQISWRNGNYGGAMRNLHAAIAAADQMGYRTIVGVMLGNVGVLYWEVGELNLALTWYSNALASSLDVGDLMNVLTVLGNIAQVLHAQSRDDFAERVLARALTLGNELGAPYSQSEHAFIAADIMRTRGCYADALMLNRQAAKLAAEAEDSELVLKATLQEIQLLVFAGSARQDEAVARLERVLASVDDDESRAAVHYAIVQFAPARRDARSAASRLYRRLLTERPKHEFRMRYVELTGRTPAPAPALPEFAHDRSITEHDLEELLARAGVQ